MSPGRQSDRADRHFLKLELPAEEPEELTDFEAGGLSDDRPATVDLLNVRPYADALASFIVHPETEPLVIGVHGPWGKGKSSFMGFIAEALVGDRNPGDPRVICVEFNAWRYQDAKQIWAGLASAIIRELEAALNPWRRFVLRMNQAWSKNASEMLALSLGIALALGVAAYFALDLPSESLRNFFREDKLLALGLGGGGGLLILFWRIPQLLQPVSQRILEYGKQTSYREQMGYQHMVLKDIETVHDALCAGAGNKPAPRVVVFIDDLDRCPNDKIIDILQALNLILGKSRFFVVLGVASGMLLEAIRVHYQKEKEKSHKDFAHQYLEKIIQLSFRLPTQQPAEQTQLIAQMFSEETRKLYEESQPAPAGKEGEPPGRTSSNEGAFRVDLNSIGDPQQGIGSGAATRVRDTVHEMEAFLQLHGLLDDNPRVKKQVVNLHRLVKILLQRPGMTWSRDRQQQLVAWLIFCRRWPAETDEILAAARAYSDSEDCIRAWAQDNNHPAPGDMEQASPLQQFIWGDRTPIHSAELLEQGILRQATAISRLAREE
jgi:hypothetical protein